MQVLVGGQNLLEVVDKLTAEAAAQEAALQAQKAAEAASLSRIAQLEEEHLHIEEQYSSVQVCCFLLGSECVTLQSPSFAQGSFLFTRQQRC